MTQRELPKCDACGDVFTKAHPGVLSWWLHPGSIDAFKVRLHHHAPTKPKGCHVETVDSPGLMDTADFSPTLHPGRVAEILGSYKFSAEDAAFLRETFGVHRAVAFSHERGFWDIDMPHAQGDNDDFDDFMRKEGYESCHLEGDDCGNNFRRWRNRGSRTWPWIFELCDDGTCDLVYVATNADALALRIKLTEWAYLPSVGVVAQLFAEKNNVFS